MVSIGSTWSFTMTIFIFVVIVAPDVPQQLSQVLICNTIPASAGNIQASPFIIRSWISGSVSMYCMVALSNAPRFWEFMRWLIPVLVHAKLSIDSMSTPYGLHLGSEDGRCGSTASWQARPCTMQRGDSIWAAISMSTHPFLTGLSEGWYTCTPRCHNINEAFVVTSYEASSWRRRRCRCRCRRIQGHGYLIYLTSSRCDYNDLSAPAAKLLAVGSCCVPMTQTLLSSPWAFVGPL